MPPKRQAYLGPCNARLDRRRLARVAKYTREHLGQVVDGWLSPDGTLYRVEPWAHNLVAGDFGFSHGDDMQKAGWIYLRAYGGLRPYCWFGEREPTNEQVDTIIVWARVFYQGLEFNLKAMIFAPGDL